MKIKYDLVFLRSLTALFYAFLQNAIITETFTGQRFYEDLTTGDDLISFPFLSDSEPGVLAYAVKGTLHSESDQSIDARFKFDHEILAISLNGQALELREIKRAYGVEKLFYTEAGYVIPLALRSGKNTLEVGSHDFGDGVFFQIEIIRGIGDFIGLFCVTISLGLLIYCFIFDADRPNRLTYYLVAALSCCFLLLLRLINGHPFILDEFHHFLQLISLTQRGELYEGVTPLPGYHLLLTTFGLVFDQFSLLFFRLISFGIAVFSFVARSLGDYRVQTLQYAFFPLLFPYFFLLYTEALSATLVLLCMGFLLRDRFHLAGALGILGVLVRQNNIIWLAFARLYILWHKYRFDLRRDNFGDALKDTSIALLGGIAFVVFVIANDGVAMAVSQAHPSYQLHPGNVYFLLFCAFFLFLPLNLDNAGHVYRLLKARIWVLPCCALCLLFFFFTFEVDYPFNFNRLLVRNNLLHWVVAEPWRKLAFWPVCGLRGTVHLGDQAEMQGVVVALSACPALFDAVMVDRTALLDRAPVVVQYIPQAGERASRVCAGDAVHHRLVIHLPGLSGQ
ncbi:MAG: hypothetical protein HOI20_17560 [Gemmatimonadetes bacterium]|jgi:hypothetical protein|nr:hypothetical protein [Gemmatimonadota bacterium]MBT5450576.1 hypothetical protein [Gemmatimonadota bacterium]MBT5803399.1 hypothetical protein [Gemmatimonadota bacterium]MBT6623131.1 hypothetical protein [Gemmatimonadota bacterium]MBT6903028.1 hypothetical protein [Gemmatimonadota bacterium]